MRHGKAGYKLGRTTAHRTATLRNLAASLLQHGQITTTIPRAKALQPFVEKIITKAKAGGLHARRQVIAQLGYDREAFHWLYQPDAKRAEKDPVLKATLERAQTAADRASKFFELPKASEVEVNRYGEFRKAPKLVKHVFDNVAPRFKDRAGGYTRIVKLGRHRIGDAGELCVIQFVGAEEGPEIGGQPSTRRRTADRRTKFAASLKKA
jgi:large subunit ribosomal protein L17